MTHLNWIDIENFRGIAHIHYEPKQINLFVGRNNSGKTSILEAIYSNLTGLFGGERRINVRPSEKGLLYRTYDVKLGTEKALLKSDRHIVSLYRMGTELPEEFKESFNLELLSALQEIYKDDNLSDELFNRICFFVQTKIPLSVSTFDGKTVFLFELEYLLDADEYAEEIQGLVSDIGKSLKRKIITNGVSRVVSEDKSDYARRLFRLEIARFLNLLEYRINQNKLPKSSSVVESSELKTSLPFDDTVRLIELEKLLKEYQIIPNLERLTPEGVVYNLEDGNVAELPYEMHGDGFVSLLRLFYQMYEAKDGVFLIEEPENHMHPGYLQVFVEQLLALSKMLNVQVFMTSHSSDLIEELSRYPMDEKEEHMIQITKVVHRSGRHELYSHTPEEARHTLRDLLIDLRGT